ncbi:MAG: glycine zipper family protein [Gammaproteobacteria bacterium]|nr:glycine zipper family protein [Gammaproteobacteria bacterium]
MALCASVLFGCASQPEQVPGAGSVAVDLTRIDMRQYQLDLADCNSLAAGTRNDKGRRMATHAGGGALAGAALGGILKGDLLSGTLIGAGTGAYLGARSANNEADRIVRNCLRDRGYRILN